jgi:hypothetical protein
MRQDLLSLQERSQYRQMLRTRESLPVSIFHGYSVIAIVNRVGGFDDGSF